MTDNMSKFYIQENSSMFRLLLEMRKSKRPKIREVQGCYCPLTASHPFLNIQFTKHCHELNYLAFLAGSITKKESIPKEGESKAPALLKGLVLCYI